MKILMVTPMLPHPRAGTAQPLVMHAQLTGLAAHHEVTLATFAGPDPTERDALVGLRESGIELEAVWRWPTSGVRQLKRRVRLATDWLRGGRPLRTLWFWNSGMQRLLDRLLREKSFDVVHVEDNAMANYRLQTATPRVLTQHDVRAPAPDEFDVRLLPLGNHETLFKVRWIRHSLNEAERRRWEKYQPSAWRRFDRIQVFTERDAEIIRSMATALAGRVRVNPFGVTPPAEVDGNREERDTVIFVGMFLHPANIDAALWITNEIMPLLRRQRPGIRLIIVGGQPPESVRALASEDIMVTGYVPAVQPFLERAAVVLAPLRVGGGMRMKVLEAMAMGKAVVTTPRGAEGLAFYRSQPPLVISRDAEGIASITSTLLASEGARRALGRRARAFVLEHHSWPAFVQRLEAMYAELQSAIKRPHHAGHEV